MIMTVAYVKKVLKKLEEKGDAKAIEEFKKGAPAAVKKLLANYDNYDVLMGQSMDGDAMYVSPGFPLPISWRCTNESSVQARSDRLPRGRCYPLRHSLEARP